MDFTTFLYMTFGAFLTLATFSFLYKDNPFYKFAEHLVVGVSAGYFVIILWFNGLVPKLFMPLSDGDWFYLWLNSTQPWYVIPAILGALMWTRFSRDYSWVSRWPMAMYIGISAGAAVPLEMSNRVNKQLFAMMADWDWSNFFGSADLIPVLDPYSGLSQAIVFAGSLAGLIYFYFSKAHTGAFGRIATFGIWILMIGFGASFGFTVMARISLFINRIQDVDQWGQTAFDSSNANYHVGFQVVFWLLVAVVLGYAVLEIIRYTKRRGAVEP